METSAHAETPDLLALKYQAVDIQNQDSERHFATSRIPPILVTDALD